MHETVHMLAKQPLFTCPTCGKRGADVRPNFHWMGEARCSDGLPLVPRTARFDRCERMPACGPNARTGIDWELGAGLL
jgi:hypothetical protein